MKRSAARRKKKFQCKKYFKSIILGVIFVWLVIIILLYFFTPSRWDGETQFSYIYLDTDQVVLRVLEPDTNIVTDIIIPGSTQVQVANQMGTWRLESVWQLGQDEGLDGLLLSRTLSKSFLFPVDAWSEKPIDSLGSVLTSFKTNLSLKDKLKIYLFWLAASGKEELDFKNTKLTDSLKRLLNYSTVSSELSQVELINMSKNKAIENWLVSLIEVIGAKVFSISEISDKRFERCLVISNNNLKTAKVISRIFDCSFETDSRLSNQTVKIYIDDQFVREY